MWLWWGSYGISALIYAVEHCLAGESAKTEYVKEPIFFRESEKENGYKESKEEVAVFEMKQRIKFLEKQGLPESPL